MSERTFTAAMDSFIAWLQFDAAVRRMVREVQGAKCEQAEPPEPDVHFSGTGPCWQQPDTLMSRSEWCDSCKHIAPIRLTLKQARRERYTALRRIRRAFDRHQKETQHALAE